VATPEDPCIEILELVPVRRAARLIPTTSKLRGQELNPMLEAAWT